MLIGKKVTLRAVEKGDLEVLREWRNRPHFRMFFREYREINSTMQEIWYDKYVVSDNTTIMFTILDNATSKIIGCCGLCYINWIQRNSDLSLYIGRNDSYIDDEGFAEETCKILFDYGFNELGLHRIWTEIYETDILKYNLFMKIGMKQDATLRDNYYYNGKWINSRIMSMLSTEFK